MPFFILFFIDFELFVETFYLLLMVIRFVIELCKQFVVIGNFNDIVILYVFKGLYGLNQGLNSLRIGLAFADQYFSFFYCGFGILLGLFPLFCLENCQHLLNKFQSLSKVLKLQIATGYKPQGFDIIGFFPLSLAAQLYIMGFLEYLKGIVVASNFKIASTVCGEDIGMVEFDFIDVIDFGVLFQRHGEVVEGLFVALVVEVGFSEVVMGFDEVKLGFAMGVDEDLGQGQFVHSHLEDFLGTVIGKHDFFQQLIELDLQFLTDEIWLLFAHAHFFHDEAFQLRFRFFVIGGVIGFRLGGQVIVILVVVVVDLVAFLYGLL